MLVLSRKVGEKVVVNGSITVEVISVDRGKVRLGISAPPEVSVHRKEVFDRILEFGAPEMVDTRRPSIAR
jgi:carbon storage regulator